MEKTIKTKKKFNFGWKSRHLLVLIISVIGTYLLLESRAQWSDMHKWNRAVGDMSFILIAVSMAVGPLSRLIKFPFSITKWRRELGVYGVILAIIHTAIILVGWINWDFMRLFGFELHPEGMYVMLQHGFGLANAIGIVALFYGIVLAISSNNVSQRFLSGTVWKFLQQSSYVLWMLIVVHTAYFLFLHFLDFHKATPEPNWVQIPFLVLVSLVLLLQFLAFLKTWRVKLNSQNKTTSKNNKIETAKSSL
ncbi:MAG: ferric reductase-like transmembrane domain-containing protein [Devosiaceae bacterium]|nr:ferric reductase-like transmembrane domain-containing protein [Devosiaceae bacterium]